jgi:hypothetical protein
VIVLAAREPDYTNRNAFAALQFDLVERSSSRLAVKYRATPPF